MVWMQSDSFDVSCQSRHVYDAVVDKGSRVVTTGMQSLQDHHCMLGVSSLIAKLRTCIRLFWSRFAGEYDGAGYRTGHPVRAERFKYVLYARVHELGALA